MNGSSKIGSLHFKKDIVNEIGVNFIYSPSRLYSISMPNDVVEETVMLTENNITVLNCASLEIFKYKLMEDENTTEENEKQKLNALYWLNDNVIVAITQKEDSICQSVFRLDHTKHTIRKIETRLHKVGASSLYQNWRTFSTYLATVVLGNIEYIVWFGYVDREQHRCCFHMLPKNPFVNVKAKKFYANPFNNDDMFAEILEKIDLPDALRSTFPIMTCNNKLICRLFVIKEDYPQQLLSLFGTYVAIDVDKLIDVSIFEMNDMDLDYEQADAYSLIQLPKPDGVAFKDFYRLQDAEIFHAENYYLTTEKAKDTYELTMIQLDSLEWKKLSVPIDGCGGFTSHPNGLILQWWTEADSIEFKKHNLCWKTDSLEELSRKKLLFEHNIPLSEVVAYRSFIYPGSTTKKIQKMLESTGHSYLSIIYLGILISSVGFTVYNMFRANVSYIQVLSRIISL